MKFLVHCCVAGFLAGVLGLGASGCAAPAGSPPASAGSPPERAILGEPAGCCSRCQAAFDDCTSPMPPPPATVSSTYVRSYQACISHCGLYACSPTPTW